MKIVVASDSFKGSLSSAEVAAAASEAILEVLPDAEVLTVRVADGGEGTVDAIVSSCGGELVSAVVSDPLMHPVKATYGISGSTAVIEMASASGLALVPLEERNPLNTTTRGTGELILDALNRGCTKILMGIGGSATNDAGTGMLSALGFRFLDASGNELPGTGASLGKIDRIDSSAVPTSVRSASFSIACDVDAPFCGPRGAAYVFGPQKGADPGMVSLLDEGMAHFAGCAKDFSGIDIREVPGAGAAGGLGGAFISFLDARLVPGIEMVLDAISFDDLLEGVGLVITGEGHMDQQTLAGKAPLGVLRHASSSGIPVIAICGNCSDKEHLLEAGFTDISEITPAGMPLEEAMNTVMAAANVKNAVKRLITRKSVFLHQIL